MSKEDADFLASVFNDPQSRLSSWFMSEWGHSTSEKEKRDVIRHAVSFGFKEQRNSFGEGGKAYDNRLRDGLVMDPRSKSVENIARGIGMTLAFWKHNVVDNNDKAGRERVVQGKLSILTAIASYWELKNDEATKFAKELLVPNFFPSFLESSKDSIS